jgi:hypothetical protein
MSRESMRGISQEKEVYALTRKIASNVAFMTKEDIKVLEYLATKGDYSDKVIKLVDKKYVPFISEVEEFNAVMGKPNNYEPIIPERKEWEFVYNFVLEELEEYREACEGGDIVEILDALCDITYVAVGNGAMLHGLRFKRQIYLKLAKQKKKLKQQSIKEASNKVKHVITKKLDLITSFIEQETKK